MTVPSYLPTYPIPQSPSSPRRLCFSFDERDEAAKGAGRASVTEAAREDDGKWWRPPATGDEASKQTLSTMLKLIPRDNACLSSFSLSLSFSPTFSFSLSLSRLTRYRVLLLSMLYLPLPACIRLYCNELLYLNRRTLAFSCLISRYLTQRFRELLRRTERVVLLNAGISALLYRRLPLTLWAASLHAHLHTLPNH